MALTLAATAPLALTGLAGAPPSQGAGPPTCGGRTATIVGRGGNDDIEGRGCNVVICGNRGRDDLEGDRGNDHMYGGRGVDEAEGGLGADVCFAEKTESCVSSN